MAKLLVSDDDPQVLDLVKLVLEDAGHSVVATGDAGEVCKLAAEPGIDAIVLDVNMPKSGLEILSELRSEPATAALPVLLLSGLRGSEDRARGLVEGADDYMVKPFQPAELVLRVERMLSFRQPERTSAARPRVDTGKANDGKLLFGRYEVVDKVRDVIGQGSMGTVYRGRDPRLQREVALKTIRLEKAASDDQHEMFERLRTEAITLAGLSHPNILAVHDMGGIERSAFIAMELIDGPSLRDVLRIQGRLSPDKVIPLAAAVVSGLALAHARDVIHRDVKPGNVLLGRNGAIKVSDFGLAFITIDSNEISGTPGYVPPEVLSSRPYTKAGDIFGLGATLYKSLAGVHPLTGKTLRETILNTLRGKVQPLREHVPEIPAALEKLVMSLLATDPGDRPSAAEAEDGFEQLAVQHQLRWTTDFLPLAPGLGDPQF